jgi:hypothetical protein
MMGCTSCFQNPVATVPVAIDNRPGLSAIAYRIGTFTSFRQSMLDQIAGTPELAALSTRLSDDYSITVLELWSAVADVLTFYQERIANEAYLRTATLRDSVLRLVRLIDYQLQPGLAPTALLAFTLEAGAAATIPTGLRVQSVPAGNASPQKYETIESIAADARFNSLAILPAPESIVPLRPGSTSELFAPGADLTAFAASLAPGDRLVAYTPSAIEFLPVASVAVQADRMSVQWTIPPSADFHASATGISTDSGLFKVGRTFRLFGYDAPTQYITAVLLNPPDQTTLRAQLTPTPHLSLNSNGFALDARYDGIKPGTALLIDVVDTSGNATMIYATVQTVTEAPAARGPIAGVATSLTAMSPGGPFNIPGIIAPSSAPYVFPIEVFLGGLVGTYTIQVTFTGATQESMPSPPSAPIAVSSAFIEVFNIPTSPDPTVTGRRIYGFKDGVSSAYQLIGTINDNTSNLFTVEIDQPAWTTSPPSISSVTIDGSISSVTIYELLGPQLRLLPAAFPSRLSAADLYLSGYRNGWDSIEVGRVIVKGVIQPGVTVGVNDLAAGQEVILVDADSTTAVSATVAGTELFGDQLSLGVAGDDVQTIAALGLDPTKAQGIAALASPPFASTVALRNARLQLLVTIGQQPPQTVTLAPPLAAPGFASVSTIAAALQAAIQAALPAAPEFANALAFNSADLATGPACLVVVPGVADVAIAVAPTPSDPDTVVDLGLDANDVRYLDGVLSGPLDLAAAVSGSLMVSLGILPPQLVTIAISTPPPAMAQQLASQIASQLGLTDSPIILALPASGRMLSFPPAGRFERPAFLHVTIAPDAPINLDPTTAVLLGNVAQASLGETVANEIVGDGDASVEFPTFTLMKKPVTFLLGDGPHGAQSSLTVAVGGVNWQEVATLYGAGPNDEVFVTSVADDTTLTMEFGDGNTGARLPTGRANIVATYRQGIGLAGQVGANTLTSLLDSINGVKQVTNPIASDGGADPQTLADAQTNAPSTVRTFGRAVSLQDFEDVAEATGEIAKASATWVWTGLQKTIFLTVAAQAGAKLSPDGLSQLWSVLLSHRDPNHPLRIANFVRVPIIVTASLIVDPRYNATAVQAAAFSALASALSFDQLQLGQAISLSSIYGVIQGVPGVIAVDITNLNFKSQDPTFRTAHGADNRQPQPTLFILGARPGTGPGITVLPAELAWVDIPTQDLVLTVTGTSGN